MTQTSNREHESRQSTELSPEAARLYSVAKVEEWRAAQHDVLNTLRSSAAGGESYNEFIADIDDQLDGFLRANGLDGSDSNYDEIRRIYRDASIDRVSLSEWYTSAQSRGEPGDALAYQVVLAEQFKAKLATADTTAEAGRDSSDSDDPRGRPYTDELYDEALAMNAAFDQDAAHANDPSMDELHEQALEMNRQLEGGAELEAALTAAREKWAAVSAKRQGRIGNFGIKERKAIEADYHAKANALIIHELRGLLADPNETDEFKQVAVVQHLFNEQAALRELTKEKLKGTKLNKFVAFMNRGNLPVRVAKGVGLGVAAGFLGTLLAGAAGAGLVAGGAIAASRFVKGYAAHDKEIGTKSIEDVIDSERLDNYSQPATAGVGNRVQKLGGYFNETFEEDTRNEQNKRRKAFAWGAGSVAVGATLGYGLHALIDRASDLDLRIGNPFNNDVDLPDVDGSELDGDLDDDGTPDVNDHDRDGDGTHNRYDATPDGDATVNPEALDRDGDGVRNWIDADPDDPSVTGPATIVTPDVEPDTTLDWSDFNREARWIEPGEGGFQTLKEMGIPESKWEAIWQDAGSKLNDQGKTYMMDDGRWGWDHTMRLSDNDLTIIADAAARNGVTL